VTDVQSRPTRSVRSRRHRPQPTVSIVINTLNRCNDLRNTLASLESLRYPDFEVIVVNGPSSDATDEVVRSYADRVRAASCPVAQLGPSRNIGIDHAAGEIVAFLDDDARPSTEWLERLVPAFDDPDVGAAGGPVFDVPLGRVDWQVCTSTRTGMARTDSPGPIEQYQGSFADPFMYLAGCNMAFRRSALVEIGGFNEQLAYGYDDVEVCRLLTDVGWHIGYRELALVVHDRAPSAVRDGERRLSNPAPFVEARCTVVMQACTPNSDVDALRSMLREWGAAMRDTVLDEGSHGWRTPEDAAHVAAEIDAAVERGLTVGAAARPHREIATRVPDQFRRFEPEAHRHVGQRRALFPRRASTPV
jgi:GT2 family glycosyltransferase